MCGTNRRERVELRQCACGNDLPQYGFGDRILIKKDGYAAAAGGQVSLRSGRTAGRLVDAMK